MTDQELVDLLAYLATLRQPVSIVGQYQAMGPIPESDGAPRLDPTARLDLERRGRRRPGPRALVAAGECQRRGAGRPGPLVAGDAKSGGAMSRSPVVSPIAQKARLVFDTPAEIAVWLDGKPVTLSGTSGDKDEPADRESSTCPKGPSALLIRVPLRGVGVPGLAGHNVRGRSAGRVHSAKSGPGVGEQPQPGTRRQTDHRSFASTNADANAEITPRRTGSEARIAVAIPCYNEAAAIATVVAQFRAALPDAEIVVFDNNSTDGTGEIARGLGVRVVDGARTGEGPRGASGLRDAELTMTSIVLDRRRRHLSGRGRAAPDRAGARRHRPTWPSAPRQPTPGAGAMTLIRGMGNRLIRAAFRLLIGPGNTDLLSGYRAFSRRFRAEVELRSSGFEIETELAGEAVARGLRVVEIPSRTTRGSPGPRASCGRSATAGGSWPRSSSQGMRLRPVRLLLMGVVPLIVLGVTVHWGFAAAAGLYALILWASTDAVEDLRPRKSDESEEEEPRITRIHE